MEFPRRYLITGDAESEEHWWSLFEKLLNVDDSFVQLRLAGTSHKNRAGLVASARDMARRHGRKLLLNGPVEQARELAMDGVHLTSMRMLSLHQRPLTMDHLVGASCHNMRELEHAQQIGVDFVCLSPVFPTPSHPRTAELGLKKFEAMASKCKVPVFALGGIRESDLDRIRAAGGYGISGISAFWSTHAGQTVSKE